MSLNNQYATLSEAQKSLMEKGYNALFDVSNDLKLVNKDNKYSPSQVKVIEFHRFEGITNPSDSSIIYALETDDGVKGVIIDAYDASGSKNIADFMMKAERD